MLHKKRRPRGQNRWQPHADDAIKLAAIRWFACRIESQAIQIYATDATKYHAIEQAMYACVEAIHDLQKDVALSEGDCPPGYVLCGQECAPMCDNEE